MQKDDISSIEEAMMYIDEKEKEFKMSEEKLCEEISWYEKHIEDLETIVQRYEKERFESFMKQPRKPLNEQKVEEPKVKSLDELLSEE